ncbi:MAG: SDR family oxidoreductase [Pseudomonadota bacterium]
MQASSPSNRSKRQFIADPTRSNLFTGANRGLGAAIASAFHEDGWHVIGTARRPETLDRNMIDVSDPESVRSVAEEITNPKAWITLLVNNAGFDPKDRKDDPDYFQSTCKIVSFSAENVSQSVRINALAPTELVSKLVPVLAEDGVVLNILSWLGSIGGKSSGDWT